MGNMVHLIKLSVGSESIETMQTWQHQRARQAPDRHYAHVTRMWPKREADVLAGGSIYWVIKGEIQARQRVLRFDERFGQDGIRRCGFILDPEVIRTVPTLKRPFQGWRYLDPADAPMDLPEGHAREAPLPADLSRALAEIGVL